MAYKDILAAGVISGLLVASTANAQSVNNETSVMSSPNFPTQIVPKKDLERCFGISKRGKNDCGTSIHSCAGQALTNDAPTEWIYVLKGNCAKITGGSLDPIQKITTRPRTDEQVIIESNPGSNESLY